MLQVLDIQFGYSPEDDIDPPDLSVQARDPPDQDRDSRLGFGSGSEVALLQTKIPKF